MTGRPVVAFVTSGGPSSSMAERARSFATRLSGEFDARLLHAGVGRASAAAWMLRDLFAIRPAACLVFDVAVTGVAAAGAYKSATGTPFVIDTGDAVVELGRALGRGPLKMAATRALESFAMKAAARVVVRGSHHRELLAAREIRAEFIPDGVVVDQFALEAGDAPSPPGRPLTIGLMGASIWIPTLNTCYGWELVELIRLLRDRMPGRSIRGLMIGDGSGIEFLRRRCEETGIADRVEFAGRVAYDQLPGWLRKLDIGLSTQSNDVIGNVRTTGKLPLYLASGRFVLASQVGEAARVLPPEMLVEYRGTMDADYPARLADRVAELLSAGTVFVPRHGCVALARAHFDYDQLAPRMGAVIRDAVGRRRGRER
jgi:glycosyltransferase involved in cell wall biosynthesis